MSFAHVLLISFGTILVAELITDKSLYAIASLSLRFRLDLVLLGTTAAFAGKMLLAVLLGQALARISEPLAAFLSAMVFFLAAISTWVRKPTLVLRSSDSSGHCSRVAIVP